MIRGCLPAAVLAAVLVGPAGAEAVRVDYLCERGARLAAAYVNHADPQVVVMQIEGQQVVLTLTISGSGAFYEQAPEGQAGYFWRSKGPAGMLSWRRADGSEIDLLQECAAQG